MEKEEVEYIDPIELMNKLHNEIVGGYVQLEIDKEDRRIQELFEKPNFLNSLDK